MSRLTNYQYDGRAHHLRHTNEVPETANPEIALEVKNLNRAGVLKNINFHIEYGRNSGLCRVDGAGRTEVARAIFGADPIDSGEIFVHGTQVYINSPTDAVRAGLAISPKIASVMVWQSGWMSRRMWYWPH